MVKRIHRRPKRPRHWLRLFGLAALLAILILAAYWLRPSVRSFWTAVGKQHPSSLEGLRLSLDSLSSHGWQAWFNAVGDTVPAQWRIVVPPGLPLVAANLSVHRLCKRHRVTVESSVEDRRRRLLGMMLSDKDGRQARLVIRKRAADASLGQGRPILALVAYQLATDWAAQSKRLSTCPQALAVAGGTQALSLGREILRYLPMEPKGYPKQDPGPNTLLVDDSPSAMRAKMARILSSIPRAVGLCVHYGSRAVEDKAVMAEVAGFCAAGNLPLLEPAPTASSLVAASCREVGAGYFKPDVYIVASASLGEARASLAEAVKVAEKRGQALVLFPATDNAVRAVREMFPVGRESSCRLVAFSKLGGR